MAASGTTSLGSAFTVNSNGSFSYTPAAHARLAATTDTFHYQGDRWQRLECRRHGDDQPGRAKHSGARRALDSFTRATAAPSLGAELGSTGSDVIQSRYRRFGRRPSGRKFDSAGRAGDLECSKLRPDAGRGLRRAAARSGAKAYLVLKATGPDPKAPVNYVRVGCEAGQVVVYTMMGGSNTSAYVKQAVLGACASGALSAVVDAKGLVTAFVGSSFVGGVQLPDVGAWKGGGRIGIQLHDDGCHGRQLRRRHDSLINGPRLTMISAELPSRLVSWIRAPDPTAFVGLGAIVLALQLAGCATAPDPAARDSDGASRIFLRLRRPTASMSKGCV